MAPSRPASPSPPTGSRGAAGRRRGEGGGGGAAPTSRPGSVHLRRTRRRGHDLASVTLACAVRADGVTQLAYGSLGPRPGPARDETRPLAGPTAPGPAKMARPQALFV